MKPITREEIQACEDHGDAVPTEAVLALLDRAEAAERERDEWKANAEKSTRAFNLLNEGSAASVFKVMEERDQVRDEVKRLTEERDRVRAQVAMLREALEEITRLMDGMEAAWGVIANASGGDWSRETEVWQDVARRWRDEHWHPSLDRNGYGAIRALAATRMRPRKRPLPRRSRGGEK